MSILKSTKAGKSGIELTLYYLLTHGWYQPTYKESLTGKIRIEQDKICPQEHTLNGHNHFLHIIHNKEGIARMLLVLKQKEKAVNEWGIKPEYTYKFHVNSLADLELVYAFWNEQKINRKRTIRDAIMNLSEKESNMWFTAPAPDTQSSNYLVTNLETMKAIKKQIYNISGIKK